MTWNARRLALTLILLALATLLAAIVVVAGGLLDEGDRNDTTSDVATLTLAPETRAATVRTFEVDANNSEVRFTTDVAGVAVEGVFPVQAGTIRLQPVGDGLRVHVYLEIDVDHVSAGSAVLDQAMRVAMASGDYPLAFYAATSVEPVPVTEDPIAFTLHGDLEVRNVVQPHDMQVDAQLVGGDMQATAHSVLDLRDHGVTLPDALGGGEITLTVQLHAAETAASPAGN